MSSLSPRLLLRARAWAGQLTILAQKYAPNHLKTYISSKADDNGDGTYRITITVNKDAKPLPSYGSLDAEAQEYGANPHIIDARKKYLIFAGTHTHVGELIKVPSVNHPGMEAYKGQGYIRPAAMELEERGLAELSTDVREAILSDIRAAFGK